MTHKCSKEEEIEALKYKINEIHKAVVGGYNGEDGLRSDVRMLNANVNSHKERISIIEKSISNLNVKMGYYAGGVAVIVFVITWLAPRFGG